MEKKLILQNEVAEISKLAIFIEELGEEFRQGHSKCNGY